MDLRDSEYCESHYTHQECTRCFRCSCCELSTPWLPRTVIHRHFYFPAMPAGMLNHVQKYSYATATKQMQLVQNGSFASKPRPNRTLSSIRRTCRGLPGPPTWTPAKIVRHQFNARTCRGQQNIAIINGVGQPICVRLQTNNRAVLVERYCC